jgi:hypothetical protein
MQRFVIIASLISLAACTPGAAEPNGLRGAPPTVDVGTVTGTRSALALIRQSDIGSHPFQAEPEGLWPHLVELFSAMELPVTVFSTNSYLIGMQNEPLRRIGGQSVSRYFHCAGTGYGNPASSEIVVVTVVAQLVPGGEGRSELRMVAAATSRPTGGAEGWCRSTGVLERRVHNVLKQASAAAGS